MKPVEDPEIRLRAANIPSLGDLALLDILPHAAAVLDDQGRVLAVNRTWRTLGEVDGIPAFDLRPRSSRRSACDCAGDCPLSAIASASVVSVISGEQPRVSATAACESGGKTRWFQVDVATLSLETGRGALVTCVDISAYKLPLAELAHLVRRHA